MVLMSAEERVAVRVVGPSDVESARRLCRTIQAGMARQEAAAHLIRLLIHPYFATLILLTSVLLRCALQVYVVTSVGGAAALVAVLEAIRFWVFWRKIAPVFREGPDLKDLLEYYSHPGRLFLVAEVGGEVAATIALRETDDPSTAKLLRMFVHPRFRRRGLASRLIAACHKGAVRLVYTAVELRTHDTNHRALRCYEKAGYVALYKKNFAHVYPHTFDTVHYIWKK